MNAVLHSASRWCALFSASALLFRLNKDLRLHTNRLPLEAASRVVGATHAAWASFSAFKLAPQLLEFWAPAQYMLDVRDRPSTRQERAVLEGSLGYFVWDFIYLLLWERDPLFLVHHVAVFTSAHARAPTLDQLHLRR